MISWPRQKEFLPLGLDRLLREWQEAPTLVCHPGYLISQAKDRVLLVSP